MITLSYVLVLPTGRPRRPPGPRECVPARDDVIDFGDWKARVAERWLLETGGGPWLVFLTPLQAVSEGQWRAAGFLPPAKGDAF